MQVTITTGGSHGEVQPYVALGLGLKGAGYEIRIATQAAYEGFVSSNGLDIRSLATRTGSSQRSWRRAIVPSGSRDASGASWNH
jgi:UDP:flavonoid glycosyltransferase YjiC (YdhE family)